MTPELTVLTLAALLQVIQFGLMAVPVNLELGTAKTMGPRDPGQMNAPMSEQISPKTGRLVRALNNHFEGLILFGIACTVIAVSDQSTWLTVTCAWLYLAARVAYVPAYYFGLVPGRSLIWAVGFGATTLMLLAALF
ncbi:MAPEG family protein [Roseovarius sp. S1116L3]|uniref:MAPEG family protein n=1 Tax=Roseovarius roseus TaxID=3342636 RepID=UPI0037280EC5